VYLGLLFLIDLLCSQKSTHLIMPASFWLLLPFLLTTANYKLLVLQPIDECLENFKVMENIKVITRLICHH